jgi:hypothetical protein
MLEQSGLSERADERVEQLSGGNRQRVNVAVALLAEPRVLALDEPSSALDPGQRARLWDFVGALAARGTSVLFSTHHLGEVRRYASRAIVLAEGEVLFDGAPEELMRVGGIGTGALVSGALAMRFPKLQWPSCAHAYAFVNGILPPRRAGLHFWIQFVTVPAATTVTWAAVRAAFRRAPCAFVHEAVRAARFCQRPIATAGTAPR